MALRWDGSSLSLRNNANQNVIILDAAGESYFARPMTLGVDGGIWQGTGTFATPTTGLKLWNDGGEGKLEAWAGSAVQVTLDKDGIVIQSSLAASNPSIYNTINWADAGGSWDGRVWVYNTPQITGLFLEVKGRDAAQGAAFRVNIEDDDASQSIVINGYASSAIGATRYDMSLDGTLLYRLNNTNHIFYNDVRLETNLVSRKNSTNYGVYAMRYLTNQLTSTSWDGDSKTSANKIGRAHV